MKYLSAKNLEINPKIKTALIDIRNGLESGEYKHEHRTCNKKKKGHYFNMTTWGTYTDCKTVKCIGGWVEVKLDREIDKTHFGKYMDFKSENGTQEFFNLCHPNTAGICSWYQITIPMAVKAIDNYLTLGKSNWRDIALEAFPPQKEEENERTDGTPKTARKRTRRVLT